MPEIDRLYGGCDCIDLAFVEQERAPRQNIELGIQLHLAGSSCSNTKQYLERSGVERGRTAIHNWIQQTDVQPTSEAEPNHIALAETMIQLDDERHGCTPLSILIPMNSCMCGCFRRGPPNERYCFSANSKRRFRR